MPFEYILGDFSSVIKLVVYKDNMAVIVQIKMAVRMELYGKKK